MSDDPHNSFQNPTPQTTRLIEVLENLESHIKIQNSLRTSFLKGIVYGLGTVIGATVLVALFGGAIATTINAIDSDANTEQLLNDLE